MRGSSTGLSSSPSTPLLSLLEAAGASQCLLQASSSRGEARSKWSLGWKAVSASSSAVRAAVWKTTFLRPVAVSSASSTLASSICLGQPLASAPRASSSACLPSHRRPGSSAKRAAASSCAWAATTSGATATAEEMLLAAITLRPHCWEANPWIIMGTRSAMYSRMAAASLEVPSSHTSFQSSATLASSSMRAVKASGMTAAAFLERQSGACRAISRTIIPASSLASWSPPSASLNIDTASSSNLATRASEANRANCAAVEA
mmetsp:Transcript_40076/g.113524  ORF Transcript_40076/g.113524 Transcript_40076/m.113524 type:complete len:262 (-) Transcript_40076:3593-4378(-)